MRKEANRTTRRVWIREKNIHEKGGTEMIVRAVEEGYLLIRQHDHGLVAGEIGDHWDEWPYPDPSVRLAVRFHDVGWEPLDAEIQLHPQKKVPFSFENYPMEAKVAAYRRGLDRVEAMDKKAGCLCSMHYAAFFKNATDPVSVRFRDEERERQETIKATLSPKSTKKLPQEKAFLVLCDDLSLFLCLNPPGKNLHPWYKQGIAYQGDQILPRWQSESLLEIPYITQSFFVDIPYQIVNGQGHVTGRGKNTVQIIPATEEKGIRG